jgi:hypothetical protein
MRNKESVLTLFEGLTADQARRFRERIIPTLSALRREIVDPSNANAHSQQAIPAIDENDCISDRFDRVAEKPGA